MAEKVKTVWQNRYYYLRRLTEMPDDLDKVPGREGFIGVFRFGKRFREEEISELQHYLLTTLNWRSDRPFKIVMGETVENGVVSGEFTYNGLEGLLKIIPAGVRDQEYFDRHNAANRFPRVLNRVQNINDADTFVNVAFKRVFPRNQEEIADEIMDAVVRYATRGIIPIRKV